VAWNAWVYDPALGYDAHEHARYVETLATGRLPDPRDSREFFSPPLPYLGPALLRAAGAPLEAAVKAGQLANVLYSLGLSVLVLRLAEVLRPGSAGTRRLALALVGLVPVYPRVFSFFRAEPLLALLAAAAVLQALRTFGDEAPTRARALGLGLILGLMLLARQQGLFVIAAIGLFALARAWPRREARRLYLSGLALAAVVTVLVAGGFYLSLFTRFGTPMAFNKQRAPFSFDNRPGFFYFGTGDGKLFSDPVRSSFRGQFLPTMYADTWGDYYAYFLVYAFDHRRGGRFIPPWEWDGDLESKRDRWWLETNRFTRAAYLGRVNAVSLLPTALLAAGLLAGLRRLGAAGRDRLEPADAAASLMALVVALSLLGYVALLLTLRYPLGTTIKAAYVLPVFPFLALLGADAAAALRASRPRLFRALAGALALVALHNAPALVTAYGTRPRPVARPQPGPAPEPAEPEASPPAGESARLAPATPERL
jgi:hypothetical protein